MRGGALVGRVVGLSSRGEAFVDLPGEPAPVKTRVTAALSAKDVGRECLIVDTGGVRILTGILAGEDEPPVAKNDTVEIELERERVVLSATRELVLRCGKASITMTADGKVVIKGAQLLSAATGLHRIRGAAVQIN